MNSLKQWYAKLSQQNKTLVLWFIALTSLVAFYQGVSDSLEPVKLSARGCRYDTFWHYHPLRVVPCELLRNRGPKPQPVYQQPAKRRR